MVSNVEEKKNGPISLLLWGTENNRKAKHV
jgi:hypothetical protein